MKKKLFNRTLSVLLSVMLVIGLLPTIVFASNTKQLWVNGQDILNAQNNTVQCGEGTAVYDKASNTLTLDNATISMYKVLSGAGTAGISTNGSLNIVIKGKNTIDIRSVHNIARSIWTNEGLSIRGVEGASLETRGGIVSFYSNDIRIENAVINIYEDQNTAIWAQHGDIYIENSTVTAVGSYGAMLSPNNLSISNSKVQASNTDERYSAIMGIDGTVSIDRESQVKVDSMNSGIYGTYVVIDNSKIQTTGKSRGGIDAADVIIKGDSEVVSSGTKSMFVRRSLTVVPNEGELIEIKTGTSEENASHLPDSPFATETNLSDYVIGDNDVYFHSKVHVHVGGTATCAQQAICDDCGKPYGNLVEHKTVKTPEKTATCTENGNIEYWYCEVCGKYFSDETLINEIAKDKTVIKATGHKETQLKNTKEATCTKEGYTGDKVCKVCGKVVEQGKSIAKLSHSYKDGKCTMCGVVDPNYKKNTVVPKTYDNKNMTLWIAMMFVSGVSLLGAIAYNRKRKYNR